MATEYSTTFVKDGSAAGERHNVDELARITSEFRSNWGKLKALLHERFLEAPTTTAAATTTTMPPTTTPEATTTTVPPTTTPEATTTTVPPTTTPAVTSTTVLPTTTTTTAATTSMVPPTTTVATITEVTTLKQRLEFAEELALDPPADQNAVEAWQHRFETRFEKANMVCQLEERLWEAQLELEELKLKALQSEEDYRSELTYLREMIVLEFTLGLERAYFEDEGVRRDVDDRVSSDGGDDESVADGSSPTSISPVMGRTDRRTHRTTPEVSPFGFAPQRFQG